jgi:hypothetical protein
MHLCLLPSARAPKEIDLHVHQKMQVVLSEGKVASRQWILGSSGNLVVAPRVSSRNLIGDHHIPKEL